MNNKTYTTSLEIYSAELQKYPPLQAKDNARLLDIYHNSTGSEKEKAYQELITGNLRLVTSEAWKLFPSSLSIEDMIAEGNLGLITAIQNYKPQIHISFATYATYVIRGYILVAIADTAYNVRIPRHIFTEVKAFNEARTRYMELFDHDPSIDELVEYMHYSKKKIRKIQDCRAYLSQTSWEELKLTPDQKMTLVSSNAAQQNPEEEMLDVECVRSINRAIDSLEPDERYVITHINNAKKLSIHFNESMYHAKQRRIKALIRFFKAVDVESDAITSYKKYFSTKFKYNFMNITHPPVQKPKFVELDDEVDDQVIEEATTKLLQLLNSINTNFAEDDLEEEAHETVMT